MSFNEFNRHLIIKHKRNLKRLEIYLFIQHLKYEQNVQKRKIKDLHKLSEMAFASVASLRD